MKDRGRRPKGGERKLNQILFQEPAYVPSLNSNAKSLQEGDKYTNQYHRDDPLEVTNAAEKEYDRLDTQLARYEQNS
jgi:hypothetical protein